MTVYLDMSATAPVSTEVVELMNKYFLEEYGNAGSRTHEFGVRAKQAVEKARQQVAEAASTDKQNVIFTSGATESNNLAILGLKNYGIDENKKHIITSALEHKAVLEPIEELAKQGFEVTYLSVDESGLIDPDELSNSLRSDTLLVSIMHVNNETGSIQPLEVICDVLADHDAYLHIDAAQSYAKLPQGLDNERIDFISVSSHKLYGPMGVGALIARKRGYLRPPLNPIMFGGGQEKGLRPGTLPVPLIAGFGLACEQAFKNHSEWQQHAQTLKQTLLDSLGSLDIRVNGANTSPFILNFSAPGVSSEAAMVTLKGIAAVSNGSACTSSNYTPSHVLTAMGLADDRISEAIRMSWSHSTKELPVQDIMEALKSIRV